MKPEFTDNTYIALPDITIEYLDALDYCKTILYKQDHFTTCIQKVYQITYEITLNYKNIVIRCFEIILTNESLKHNSRFLEYIEEVFLNTFMDYMIFKNKLNIIKD